MKTTLVAVVCAIAVTAAVGAAPQILVGPTIVGGRMEQARTVAVAVELTEAQMTALTWWAETPDERGGPTSDGVQRTPAEWIRVFVTPRLGDIVRQYAAAREREDAKAATTPGVAALRHATPKKCAEVAKTLGVAVTDLPCGRKEIR